MRLTASLRSCLLLSSSYKSTVIHFIALAFCCAVTQVVWSIALLHCGERLIMVVPFEELLDAWSLQLCLVLKHLFRVSVLPLAICVFLIEVVFMLWWHKGCTYAFFTQCIPIKVCEPLVLLHNVRTFFAQSVRWLSLDQAIDQVCSLGGPATRDIIWMNLDLLG